MILRKAAIAATAVALLAFTPGPADAQSGTTIKLPTLISSMEEVQNLMASMKAVLLNGQSRDAREAELNNAVLRRLPLGVQVSIATIDDTAGSLTVCLMHLGFPTAIAVRVS